MGKKVSLKTLSLEERQKELYTQANSIVQFIPGNTLKEEIVLISAEIKDSITIRTRLIELYNLNLTIKESKKVIPSKKEFLKEVFG